MKKLLKVLFVVAVITLTVACGGESTSSDEIKSNKEAVSISVENAFESKATSFFIDEINEETIRFESIVLAGVRFSSEVSDANKEAMDMFLQSISEHEISFKSNEEFALMAEEGSAYKRISNGVFTIGEDKHEASFNYTNESNKEIQGIIFAKKPAALSFIAQDKIAIRVKGRQ